MANPDRERGLSHSPAVFGAVTVDTDFTHDGVTYTARGLWASDDGTINVTMQDGTAYTGKRVFKGMNVFRCRQVNDLGGLSLEWFA